MTTLHVTAERKLQTAHMFIIINPLNGQRMDNLFDPPGHR